MRSGIGHRASGIGHRASGIGHRASGIGHRAYLTTLENRYSKILPAIILNLNFKRGVASDDLQLKIKKVQFFAQLAV
ncbi:MAG: hypothetical protein QQW96_12705 [Tychonema bourrellyi B0820]|nr:hypothetical protein [Tychonema bourrellyi B0820]